MVCAPAASPENASDSNAMLLLVMLAASTDKVRSTPSIHSDILPARCGFHRANTISPDANAVGLLGTADQPRDSTGDSVGVGVRDADGVTVELDDCDGTGWNEGDKVVLADRDSDDDAPTEDDSLILGVTDAVMDMVPLALPLSY